MIVLAYICYVMAAFDIWTGVSCLLRGERLVAALSAVLCAMCILAGKLVMEGWVCGR